MEEFDVRMITTTTICTFICEATIANVLLNFFFSLIQFPFRLCISIRRTNRLMHGLNRKNEFNYVVAVAVAAITCAQFFLPSPTPPSLDKYLCCLSHALLPSICLFVNKIDFCCVAQINLKLIFQA